MGRARLAACRSGCVRVAGWHPRRWHGGAFVIRGGREGRRRERGPAVEAGAASPCRTATTVTGGPRKCTEPVAPLSGLPTDRRRSDRRSESHQPRTLRTRCKQHPRGASESRQGCHEPVCRKLRSFLFAQGGTAVDRMCSRPPRGKKGAGPEGPAHKFAEPGTLSSTFPTNVPLPRSAPRGASSYRRPVLGAGRNLRDRTCRIKTRPREVLAICARRGVDASTGEREAGADPVPTPSDVEHLPLELVHPPAPEGGADDRRR
jgi:hypothetical protein